MKIKNNFLKIIFFSLFAITGFLILSGKTCANTPFANIGPGATDDDGTTVTDPTIFPLENSVSTRYLRIEVKNDGSLDDGEGEGEGSTWIELRDVKAWASGSANVLRNTFSGGQAQVVEINGYDGATPYDDDLETDCSASWDPQGSLCDEDPNVDSKTHSSKSNSDSGATWNITSSESTGVLVIDMGTVKNLTELRVFQMFSDGKTTQIRFAYHPETGDSPPVWDDGDWTTFTDDPGVPENSSSPEQTKKAKITFWKAYKYIDSNKPNCPQRLKLIINGKHFDKDANVWIGNREAASVNVQSSKKIVAKFCLTKLLNEKNNHKRKIYVKNPDTDTTEADKRIDLNNIGF